MSTDYEFEMSEPSTSRCDCCGGLTVRLTRFISRGGEPFAVYYAAYTNTHDDHEVAVLVSLGPWSEDADPSERAAFYCRVRPTDDSYGAMIANAAQSPWGDADVMGRMLSREDALAHPLKDTALELLDEAFEHDQWLQGFLDRAETGELAVPLEKNFGLPDDVYALGDAVEDRAEIGRSFVVLDGKRFFVRCLLAIPVEEYEHWCVGVWIEVSKADFERARDVWDDEEAYPELSFSGTLANDVQGELDLPAAIGTPVQVSVPDPDAPPVIDAPEKGELAELLSDEWAQDDFEQYAVARAFL